MAEVNINPFGYDNYRELKKDIRNTKDEDGLRLGAPRNEHSNASIFSLDEGEVTKDDFMDRLDEIGLNDDIANAMWEILNVDSDGDSEDVLDESELDELIELYGKGAEEDDSVSLRSFIKNLGKTDDVDKTDDDDEDDSVKSKKTNKDDVSTSETSKTSSNSESGSVNSQAGVDAQGFLTVSLDELDKEKYSTDKIAKDKKTILDTKGEIDKALEKIKNGEEKPSSTDNINGVVNYNIEVGKNKRAIARYENGKLVSVGIIKQNRDGKDEYLAHSTFDENGKMDSFCLNKDKSDKAEKYVAFDAEGNLSAIYYDNNESGMSEAGAIFENGNLVSLKISSDDNGKFDKEFSVNSEGKFEQGYKLDENGNKIQQQIQPQVSQPQQNPQSAAGMGAQTAGLGTGSQTGVQSGNQTGSQSDVNDSELEADEQQNEKTPEGYNITNESNIRKITDEQGNVIRTITYGNNGKTTVTEADGSATTYETENGYYKKTTNGTVTYTDESGKAVAPAIVKGYKHAGQGYYTDSKGAIYNSDGKKLGNCVAEVQGYSKVTESLYKDSQGKYRDKNGLVIKEQIISDDDILTNIDMELITAQGISSSSYQEALKNYNKTKSFGDLNILRREANLIKQKIKR